MFLKKIKTIFRIIQTEGPFFLLKAGFNNCYYTFLKVVLKKKKAIKKVNGLYKMELELAGEKMDKALLLFSKREELETEIVKGTIKEGMQILDLGANIGYYTLLLSSLVKEQGKIYAVEPLPKNFENLKKNLGLNPKLKSNVILENVAISDTTGEADFFVGIIHNVGSLVKTDKAQTEQTIKVKTIAISEFLKNKPKIDLLRMDIEGAETKVFKDLKNVPQDKLPKMIMFEVHPEGDVDPDPAFTEGFNFLLEAGYRPQFVVSSSNPVSKKKFAKLGLKPLKSNWLGQAIYHNLKKEHLIELGARRPKLTRAILLAK